MNNVKVDIQFLKEDALCPEQAHPTDAGYDLFACFDEKHIEIRPGECKKIGTGVAIAPPAGYFGAIFPRSGMATKRGLRLTNCVGVCDETYRGEYIVPLYNDSDSVQIIYPQDKIAQLVFLPYLSVEFNKVEKLDETDRGDGGFGSTGM